MQNTHSQLPKEQKSKKDNSSKWQMSILETVARFQK
jgi:hypothetical protein